jgi:hypothetical protein
MQKIIVQDLEVRYKRIDRDEYISLTYIAKKKNSELPNDVVRNWLRNRMTIEFLGVWEMLNNPNFNPVEFDGYRKEAGLNSFTMSPQKWIETTNAIGIVSQAGKYGGTYAHQEIAMEFANWISVEFRLYMIKEFKRLKGEEQKHLEWSAKRELAKINYHIHTDAIQENLVVATLTDRQKSFVYSDEADLLNVALFGKTAKEWREQNPDKKGNVRDYATIHQLLVLANMESYNAIMIKDMVPQTERLIKLNEMAKQQLKVLLDVDNRLLLPKNRD